MMDLAEAVTAVRQGTTRSVMVKCPAHDDGHASLHVSAGKDQPVILRCHANCETAEIIAESGLDWNEVCKPLEPKQEWDAGVVRSEPIIYSYTDENGDELFQALRFNLSNGKKEFRQRHRVGGEWVWNLRDVRRVLYRLPAVIAGVAAGSVITLVEGEKDVHTAESLGLIATCNPMGAGKWSPEYTEALRGATVHVIADNDTVGKRHAREVTAALREAGCTVRTFEALLPSKDLTDHIEAGGTIATLAETTIVPEQNLTFGMSVAEYVDLSFAADEFVIPGTLAYNERVIITGFEGHGKSTLLRQIAVQVAYGIHPWTLRPMPPKRVLVIDAENASQQMQQSWQQLLGLGARHSQVRPEPDAFFIYADTEPDLTSAEGREWLMERMVAHRPDLLLIGPIQNLTARDVKDDDVVRRLKRTVNESREVCRTAIVMEHHCPHKTAGDSERSVRPYGSSLFMKWPDYGYGMRPTEDETVYDWRAWRRPRVRSRFWPEALRNGVANSAEWPWMPHEDVSGSRTIRSAR